ncbi:MAG: Fic family protein [Candidatus Faecenecus gallistercoris]|nr:Fic family protein [Candidatus Faecenecus gallistercoris]
MLIKEASEKWNISERRIRQLIQDGRIEGARKMGTTWYIPDETDKPIDKRWKEEKNYRIDLPEDYFNEVDSKLKKLNSKRPFPKETIKSLEENNILNWTYNSNAIEGNTLTLRETKVVLEGITIGGKSVKEHLEALNHKEAILFLEDLVNGNTELSEWNIKNLHALILKGIDNQNAGKYRQEKVVISGATQKPVDYVQVPEKMEKLILEYDEWQQFHPLIRAALLHGEFVFIHPFVDGNGRTARLLMNFEAMKSGYLPIIIRAEERTRYYDALDKAMANHDYTDFVKLIVEEENKILDQYLTLVG